MLPPTGSLTGFPIELKQAAQLQHAQDDFGSEVAGLTGYNVHEVSQQLTNHLIEWYGFWAGRFCRRSAL